MSAADEAVTYLLKRLKEDPRVAYYFAHTEALELLTKAFALPRGLNPKVFHTEFEARLSTERPRCRSGECHQGQQERPR